MMFNWLIYAAYYTNRGSIICWS